MSKKNILILLLRFVCMLFGWGLCVLLIVVYKGENPTGYAGPIMGFPITTAVCFIQPLELHEAYHEYAKQRYEELLALQCYVMNENQEAWFKRLLTYIKACSAPNANVKPSVMDQFIVDSLEAGKMNDFGCKDDIMLDSYDKNDTEILYDKLRPFAYAAV